MTTPWPGSNRSTFFRRLRADGGEDPDDLALDELDALLVDFDAGLLTR